MIHDFYPQSVVTDLVLVRRQLMGIYLIYAVCFFTPLMIAIEEGVKAGTAGTGLVVGLVLGASTVSGIRILLMWLVRHPHLGERLSETVWFILDILLFFVFSASLLGIGLLAQVIVRSVSGL